MLDPLERHLTCVSYGVNTSLSCPGGPSGPSHACCRLRKCYISGSMTSVHTARGPSWVRPLGRPVATLKRAESITLLLMTIGEMCCGCVDELFF